MRTAALAIALGPLAGAGWAATDSPCARWALEGLAPGMRPEEVLATRPAAGMRSVIRDLDGAESSGLHFPGPPVDLYVEFDGRADRRPPPRAVRVRLSMPPSPTAAAEVLARFGPPRVGSGEFENGLREGTAVWIDEACGVVLTVRLPSADWWLPPPGLVLELQPIGAVRSDNAPANAALRAILERAGEPEPPPPAAPVVEEVIETPPPTPPVVEEAVEEVVEEPPPAPPVVEEVIETPPPTPPVVDEAVEEVVEEPPPAPTVVEEVIETPPPAPTVVEEAVEVVVEEAVQPSPVSVPPAKPATVATWRPAIKAPDAAPPNPQPPATIATWLRSTSADSPPPSAPATIATWRPAAAAPAPSRENGHSGPLTDRAAERIAYVPAVTPPTAKWLGLKGEVTVRVIVKADGSVADPPRVLVARPMGRGFEEAAVEAVRQWRYSPAIVGGRPVDSEFTIRVEFE